MPRIADRPFLVACDQTTSFFLVSGLELRGVSAKLLNGTKQAARRLKPARQVREECCDVVHRGPAGAACGGMPQPHQDNWRSARRGPDHGAVFGKTTPVIFPGRCAT